MSQDFILHAKDKNRANVLANVHRYLDSLPPTKSWEIQCKRHVKERTDKQNAGLWGVAYPPLERETGHRAIELHDVFCRAVFGEVAVEVMGKTLYRARRTTTTDENGKRDVLPWDEFQKFYAAVQQAGAEMGVFIPDPDPNWRENKEKAE